MSCEPETLTQSDLYDGSATALHNGTPWEGWNKSGRYMRRGVEYYGFSFDIISPGGAVIEGLGIGGFVPQTSIYEVTNDSENNPYAYYHLLEGDAVCEGYELDTSVLNQVIFTTFDTIAYRATGTFDLTFFKRHAGCDSLGPDRIHLAQGVFDVELARE